jgi:hypothetical protein
MAPWREARRPATVSGDRVADVEVALARPVGDDREPAMGQSVGVTALISARKNGA